MKELLDILRGVEHDLSTRNGSFELFGLFRRRREMGWDLVVDAPWVGESVRPTIELLIQELDRAFGQSTGFIFSRLLVRPDRRFLEAVHEVVTVEHGLKVVGPGDYGNVEIARGYVITSRPATPTVVGVAADAVPT